MERRVVQMNSHLVGCLGPYGCLPTNVSFAKCSTDTDQNPQTVLTLTFCCATLLSDTFEGYCGKEIYMTVATYFHLNVTPRLSSLVSRTYGCLHRVSLFYVSTSGNHRTQYLLFIQTAATQTMRKATPPQRTPPPLETRASTLAPGSRVARYREL